MRSLYGLERKICRALRARSDKIPVTAVEGCSCTLHWQTPSLKCWRTQHHSWNRETQYSRVHIEFRKQTPERDLLSPAVLAFICIFQTNTWERSSFSSCTCIHLHISNEHPREIVFLQLYLHSFAYIKPRTTENKFWFSSVHSGYIKSCRVNVISVHTRFIQKISSVCEYCRCSTAITMVCMCAEFFDSLSMHRRNLQTFEVFTHRAVCL
jgi:hypothetical protein